MTQWATPEIGSTLVGIAVGAVIIDSLAGRLLALIPLDHLLAAGAELLDPEAVLLLDRLADHPGPPAQRRRVPDARASFCAALDGGLGEARGRGRIGPAWHRRTILAPDTIVKMTWAAHLAERPRERA